MKMVISLIRQGAASDVEVWIAYLEERRDAHSVLADHARTLRQKARESGHAEGLAEAIEVLAMPIIDR